MRALLERSTPHRRARHQAREPRAISPRTSCPHTPRKPASRSYPVPVYYPEVTEILGERVYRRLVDVPGDIDIVNVFRRPEHVPPHVDDIIAKHPRAVWMQLGIRNDEAAERLARAGIDVVQDRCLKVELMRMGL